MKHVADPSRCLVDPPNAAQTKETVESVQPTRDTEVDITPGVAALVHQINDGEICAADLSVELRQECVAYLTLQGMTAGEITQVLQISPRTVRRDRAACRSEEAIAPSSELGDELLGEYQRYLHAGIQRLTRRANDKSEPPYVRLWAEEAITRMYQKFIDTVHKLNYLSEGSTRIRHQLDMDPAHQKRQFESQQARFAMVNAIDPIAMLLGQSEIPKSMQTVKTRQSMSAPIGDQQAANEKTNNPAASNT